MERPNWIDSTLYPFKENWIEVEGNQIHYLDEGAKDAPIVLFVHPGPGWSFTWRAHIKALSETHRCIAIDLPGHGPSVATKSYKFTLTEHATCLEQFVESLDLQDITLWANDAGGPTGILVAGRQPHRFAKLVVGGTFGWDIRKYHKVTKFLQFVTGRSFRWFNRRTNLLAKTQRKMAFGTRSLSKHEGAHYTLPFKDAKSRDRPLLWFRSFLEPAIANELESNLVKLRERPCLIIFGDQDEMYKEGWHERFAKEFPDNELHVLPGVNHFPFEDAPAETIRLYKEWIVKNA